MIFQTSISKIITENIRRRFVRKYEYFKKKIESNQILIIKNDFIKLMFMKLILGFIKRILNKY